MLSLLLSGSFIAQTEKPAKKKREPRHFFNTTGVIDYYNKPEVNLNLNDSNDITKHLKTYGISQTCLNFFAPVATANWYNRDSSVNSNFHLLLSATAYYFQPIFKGITVHTLAKYGLGLRAIYNTGKKSIFLLKQHPLLRRM